MRTISTALLLVTCFPWLAACEQRTAPAATKRGPAENAISQDIHQIDSAVRLAAANKRIDELERKVGALEATPDKLDLELLTQRVTALEVKTSVAEALLPNTVPAAGAARPASGATQAVGEVRRAPASAARLSLPELERRPRLATPSQ
jgi:hypothetical protein